MKLIGGVGDGRVLWCGCLDLCSIVLRCLLTPLRNLLRSLMLLQNKRATLLVTLLSFDFSADVHVGTTLPSACACDSRCCSAWAWAIWRCTRSIDSLCSACRCRCCCCAWRCFEFVAERIEKTQTPGYRWLRLWRKS